MPSSADVNAGDTILATDHNNLRLDAIHATSGHTHTAAANNAPKVAHTDLAGRPEAKIEGQTDSAATQTLTTTWTVAFASSPIVIATRTNGTTVEDNSNVMITARSTTAATAEFYTSGGNELRQVMFMAQVAT